MRTLVFQLVTAVAFVCIAASDASSWIRSDNIDEDDLNPTSIEVLLSGGSSNGLVITPPKRISGAGSITLRIEIGTGPREWEHLFVYRDRGVLNQIIPAASIPDDTTTIWTDEIPADVYQLGLQAPPGTETSVKITGEAARDPLGGPNATFRNPNYEALDALAGDPLESVTHLLAALLIDANPKDLAGRAPFRSDVCSGLMIGPDLLLTAGHCILYDPQVCAGTLAVFGMRHDGGEAPIIRRCTEVVYIGHSIDTALLRLGGTPSEGPFPRLASTGPRSGTPVRVLQHPGGTHARVARDSDCTVQDQLTRLWPASSQAHAASTKEAGFKHHCDTQKGSSGAALLTADGQTILGVQHAGHSTTGVNLAVRADLIRYCIGYRSPNSFAQQPDDVLCK